MAIINYRFADGHTENIKVNAETAAALNEYEADEQRAIWRERKRRVLSLDKLAEQGYEPADRRIDILKAIETLDGAQRLRAAVVDLTAPERDIIKKAYYQELNFTQIAAMEYVDRRTISRRLEKIYIKIKDILENRAR